jgi:small subunit ribosomal protein S13
LVNRQRDLETNEDAHIVATEVKLTRDDDVSRIAGVKAYRGMRHRTGHKVRGQRLRSNGRKGSQQICRLADINSKKLGGHLSDDEQDRLRNSIDDYATTVPWWLVNRQRDLETNEDAHIVATEVKLTRDDDVSRIAGVKAYRGMRHRTGHKVRGQRLRSNGRKGSTLGVERKK